jgi:hypothetical protein
MDPNDLLGAPVKVVMPFRDPKNARHLRDMKGAIMREQLHGFHCRVLFINHCSFAGRLQRKPTEVAQVRPITEVHFGKFGHFNSSRRNVKLLEQLVHFMKSKSCACSQDVIVASHLWTALEHSAEVHCLQEVIQKLQAHDGMDSDAIVCLLNIVAMVRSGFGCIQSCHFAR